VTTGNPLTRRLLAELRAIDLPQRDDFVSLLASAGDPFSRVHYEPGHITGSAFVVHPHRAAVALVHHDKLDMWVQPGGHVEAGDRSVEAGARREIAEEIGVTDVDVIGLVDIDIHTFPAHGSQPTHLHFDVRYGYVSRATDLEPGEGVREAKWIDADEARRMDESIARAVRRIAQLRGW
jgi:8-oxo-dGTP pyrophosphatase MutT (NUDIX family)